MMILPIIQPRSYIPPPRQWSSTSAKPHTVSTSLPHHHVGGAGEILYDPDQKETTPLDQVHKYPD